MDILFTALRLIHIAAAVVWVGFGLATVLYIGPASAAAGESGLRFLKALLTRTSYGAIFGMAAGVTMLAGIIMYLLGAPSHFSTTGNIVLGIGALAGIAAGIHGGAVTGRASRALAEALTQHVPEGNESISADGLVTLRERAQAMASHGRLSVILVIVALIGMGAARYL